jgi:FkbM family methyltransferase
MDFGELVAYGRSPTGTAWLTNPVRRIGWWLVGPYFRGAGKEIDEKLVQFDSALRQFGEEARRTSSPGLRDMTEGTIAELVRSSVASHFAGLRKDASAVAHRLAGIEEEMGGLAKEAAAAAQFRLAGFTGFQQELRSAVQATNGRIDSLARGNALRAGDRISVGTGGLVMVASTTGMQLLVRQDDLIGRMVADGREWEPHVRQEIERSARPDGLAVDAGAYIGLHTLTMSRWFKTVHAFEPQRGIFQILCANLALSNRLNVLVHNTGLYHRAGSMRLAPQERQEVATPVVDGHPDYEHIKNAAALSFDFVTDGAGDVPAIALDDMSLENVALIKIDAQGADLHILKGAEGTIRRWRPTILFEWERDLSQQHGCALEDYTAFFADLSYDLEVLQDTTPGRQADYVARPRP